MSSDIPDSSDRSETPDSSDESRESPHSQSLIDMGKNMRIYGNTILVLMVLMFFTSIFIFFIVFQPIVAALIIIFILKAFEYGFFIKFLGSLKNSENIYGGHYLTKAYMVLLCTIIIGIVITIIGTIVVGLNIESLDLAYSGDLSIKNVFFYYTMMSAEALWLRIIEIAIPVLGVVGSVFLQKWGITYIGDRLEEEVIAPFPKEMRLMILGGVISFFGIVFSIILNLFTSSLPLIEFTVNLLQIIGSILIAVGFSRAGYYLELYTTKDKEKFFSSKIYED